MIEKLTTQTVMIHLQEPPQPGENCERLREQVLEVMLPTGFIATGGMMSEPVGTRVPMIMVKAIESKNTQQP